MPAVPYEQVFSSSPVPNWTPAAAPSVGDTIHIEVQDPIPVLSVHFSDAIPPDVIMSTPKRVSLLDRLIHGSAYAEHMRRG